LLDIVTASLALGLVSGLLAGMFGIGGGMVIVPVLSFLFTAHGFPTGSIMIMAIATSLAAIIITAIASVASHHRLGSVIWAKVLRLAPGIVVGAEFGAIIADRIDVETLRLVFVIFLTYAGIEMLRGAETKTSVHHPSAFVDFCAGTAIGLLSALVGIGGGTLTVPYLAYCHYPIRNAVAIASACGLPIALAGTASYVLLGQKAVGLPEWCIGYVYLPSVFAIGLTSIFTAPIGAKLAHRLPAKQLKRYFSILLFALAVKMVWQ
jgi:uncharacterized protein